MLEQNKTLQKFLICGLIFVAGILLVSFIYFDILATSKHGINFWDILFNGRILYFYQDNTVSVENFYWYNQNTACIYNFLVYVVFAIWNFPLWILEKYLAVDVSNNFFCLVYMKLLPLCATLICAKIIGKILKETGTSKEGIKLTQYLYLSSTVILTNVLIASRYDNLCSVFMLLSLLYYLRQNFGKFLFFSGIALCFNYLSFAMFLPLLLLKEKNIRKILKYFLFAILPYVFTNLLFIFGKTALSTGGGYILGIFTRLFSKNNGLFCWFIIFYAIIIVYSFLADKAKANDKNIVFWLSFVSITSVFAFLFTFPYWPMLMVPFFVLLIGNCKPKKYFIAIILETIAMFGMVVDKMLRYGAAYFGGTFNSMLISFLFSTEDFKRDVILDTVQKMKNTNVIAKGSSIAFFQSFFVAGVLILAFLCFPKVDELLQKSDFSSYENKLSDILIIRFVVMIGICFLPFINLIR